MIGITPVPNKERRRPPGKGMVPNKGEPFQNKDELARVMEQRFPSWLIELLCQAGLCGQQLGYRLFTVGGFVRDLILGRPNLDIDLVVEGDGIKLTRALAQKWGCSYKSFDRFGTAALFLPRGIKIDVATARQEKYERPAALPLVRSSSIRYDLYRRDFTINSLAISLAPDSFGELVDYFGAIRDLEKKVIRVLHEESFVDDPTRAFRAVRFAARFGFRISPKTARLIQEAGQLRLFDRLSGKRLFAELKLILEEEAPVKSLVRLNRLSLLRAVSSGLELKKGDLSLLRRVEPTLAWFKKHLPGDKAVAWLVYFLTLTDRLSSSQMKEMRQRLAIGGKAEREALDKRDLAQEGLARLERSDQPKRSQVYTWLKELSLELSAYLMVRTRRASARRWIASYLTHLRQVRPILRGQDLVKMGLTPGPTFTRILAELLRARLDGRVRDKQDEIELVKSIALEEREC